MPATNLKNVGIDPELDERLDRLAADQNRPKQFIIDEALGEYLLREEQLAGERREIEESWEHYQRTGLHLTNDEVMAWLERRARGEDIPMPECHT
jgi:predicted transcriptional regulator